MHRCARRLELPPCPPSKRRSGQNRRHRQLPLRPLLPRRPARQSGFVPIAPRLPVAYVPTEYRDPYADDEVDYGDEDTDYEVRNYPLTMPHILVIAGRHRPSDRPLVPLSPSKHCLTRVCPSTVIDDELVTQLGLPRYKLPQVEDNLSTLLGAPMRSTEYVKLEVTSGKGSWSSGVHLAKVTSGLPVPLLLGIPFHCS